jgi:hypothetical protein
VRRLRERPSLSPDLPLWTSSALSEVLRPNHPSGDDGSTAAPAMRGVSVEDRETEASERGETGDGDEADVATFPVPAVPSASESASSQWRPPSRLSIADTSAETLPFLPLLHS